MFLEIAGYNYFCPHLAVVSKMFPTLETTLGSTWPRHLQKTDIPNPQLRSPLGALSIMVSRSTTHDSPGDYVAILDTDIRAW